MQISIVGRHIDITDAIRDYVEKKLQKLKKYFPYLVDVRVVFYTQKINQVVEITIQANRFTIHGEEKSQDLYASVDLVIEKLDAQLKKHKERIHRKHQKKQKHEEELNMSISVFERDDIEENNPEPEIIHTRRLAIKPMSIDEAAMQMDLINQEFLVFRNAISNGINVLYRRDDGNYGLIEPEY